VAKGGALEIFDLASAQRLAAWTFGSANKDPLTLITAVCEYVDFRHAKLSGDVVLKGRSSLVVATTSLNPRKRGGFVCLFDIYRSALISTIDVLYEVPYLLLCSNCCSLHSFI